MRWERWAPRLVAMAMVRAAAAERGRPGLAQGVGLGLEKALVPVKAPGLPGVRVQVWAQGLGLATGQAPSSLAHPGPG